MRMSHFLPPSTKTESFTDTSHPFAPRDPCAPQRAGIPVHH